MNSTQTTIKRARDVLGKPMSMAFISLIGKSIVVGIITGLIVGVFRWIIDQTMKLLMVVYPTMAAHPRYLLPYLIGTLVIFTLEPGLKTLLARPAWVWGSPDRSGTAR